MNWTQKIGKNNSIHHLGDRPVSPSKSTLSVCIKVSLSFCSCSSRSFRPSYSSCYCSQSESWSSDRLPLPASRSNTDHCFTAVVSTGKVTERYTDLQPRSIVSLQEWALEKLLRGTRTYRPLFHCRSEHWESYWEVHGLQTIVSLQQWALAKLLRGAWTTDHCFTAAVSTGKVTERCMDYRPLFHCSSEHWQSYWEVHGLQTIVSLQQWALAKLLRGAWTR